MASFKNTFSINLLVGTGSLVVTLDPETGWEWTARDADGMLFDFNDGPDLGLEREGLAFQALIAALEEILPGAIDESCGGVFWHRGRTLDLEGGARLFLGEISGWRVLAVLQENGRWTHVVRF